MSTDEKPKLPQFDPDFSPDHEQNKRAAEARCLNYDKQRQMYVDREGFLCRDKFGQPL